MPTPFQINGITVQGSDGHAPQYDPNGRWTIWNLREIYRGVQYPALNTYVPKVGDWVQDTVNHLRYKVDAIDEFTLIPTLIDITHIGQDTEDLTSTGPETYRVYHDTSVTPHVLAVDARYRTGGSAATYAKIFRGHDTSAQGKVLSFLYDQNGNFLTNNLPLELASTDSHTNHSVKVVGVGHTNEALPNGELVTVVTYNAQGHAVVIQQMRVILTSFVRDVGGSTRYISHVSLKSPFLSTVDEHRLDYPINVPLQAFNMIGVVHYSDGSTAEYPVDGGRFTLLGLERFVATTEGQRIPLALRYTLQPGEISYDVTGVSDDGKFTSAAYTMLSVEQQGAYSVKLFCYPQWVDAQTGYVLQWFLMNLDRDVLFDVTPYVYFNANVTPYNPLGYNMNQMVSVRINLGDVSAMFSSYIHTQVVSVALKAPATDPGLHWSVGVDAGQSPYFGVQTKAVVQMVNQNLWRLNLSSGFTNYQEWLNAAYFDTKPIRNLLRENEAPQPTHFAVVVGNTRTEYPVAQWSQQLTFTNALPTVGTLYIEFVRREEDSTLVRLGIAGFAVHSA